MLWTYGQLRQSSGWKFNRKRLKKLLGYDTSSSNNNGVVSSGGVVGTINFSSTRGRNEARPVVQNATKMSLLEQHRAKKKILEKKIQIVWVHTRQKATPRAGGKESCFADQLTKRIWEVCSRMRKRCIPDFRRENVALLCNLCVCFCDLWTT